MRIICLEEHMVDPGLGRVTQPVLARQAPYMADIGSRFEEVAASDRPSLLSMKAATALAGAPLEQRLAAMDEHGIDMQVLSLSNPTQLAPKAEAVALARAANDKLAEAATRHPARFAGFSTLPWQDPDAAVQEVERTARDLGFTATLLTGHPGEDVLIDDARFAPVLAKLEELDIALYIHPGAPLPAVQQRYYAGFDKDVTGRLSLFGWGWHNEAGIQVVRLILSGALDRHRGLKIISGHWGEMVPFFLQRMDDTMPTGATGLARTISQTYRDQVWVTPSGMLNLPHLAFCREVLGSARIMFAVDYPYLTMTGARPWLEALPIPDEERHMIAHGNAETLLRLPKA